MNLEITQMLTVSTAHMTEKEAHWHVASNPKCEFPVLSWEYGCMLYVGVPGDRDLSILSSGMRGAIQVAYKEGIEWVRFDCDGPALEGVEAYDW